MDPLRDQLKPGAKLGPYEIVSPLGAGGMGEVWRARDTRLNREVAIKTSREQFNDRFLREARAIAALNHPNICHLYDVGPNYLVMELIEGVTLQGHAQVPLDEALRIAAQLAAALEAAHDKNIVHRDLKPANIKLTPDGVVKVLDFGLARLDLPESGDPGDSPTLMGSPTQVGTILGTAAYMAPEQARGKVADKRADIWAFGVVLFELLTGERLFAGETVSDVLAGVLKSEPDLTRVPASVRRLLARCLQKDPKKRLRDIGDYAELLDADAAPTTGVRPSRLAWGLLAAVTLATAALAFVHFRERPPQTPVIRTSILPPDKTSFNSLGLLAGPPELSPDGRRMVFSATGEDSNQLWVRSLDGANAQLLTGTEGGAYPFWSPDSQWIGFFSAGKLRKIAASGGPPLALADAPTGRGGTWSADGVIVFTPTTSSPLYRVSAAGGSSVAVTTIDPKTDISHRWPWFLPDGQHFLYMSTRRGATTIHIGALDSGKDSGLTGELGSNVIFSQGYLLFLRNATLMAQPFDPDTRTTTGDAVPLAEQIDVDRASARAAFSASAGGGLLTFQAGTGGNRQLTWFDRAGKRIGVVGERASFDKLHLSQDRKNVAVEIVDQDSRNTDIWTYDLARGLRTRLTFDPAVESDAAWSPDGTTLIFESNRKGTANLYRKASNGSGGEELLYADDLNKLPASWSPDGKSLLYEAADSKTRSDLWILPNPLGAPGASKPYPFLRTQFNERNGQFSPDGRWITYDSDESGQFEIYVAPFPGSRGKRQISTGGGLVPRWRRDGREIFYVAPNNRLLAVDITPKGDTLETGQPRALFGPVRTNGYQYDISADGQRFLVVAAPEDAVSTPLTLLQNWTATLKK